MQDGGIVPLALVVLTGVIALLERSVATTGMSMVTKPSAPMHWVSALMIRGSV